MIVAPHKYPYAIDDNGKPIYIDQVTQENRRHTHYHCYGCRKELFPVLCTKKESHFRHEKGALCDPDRYLHEYAKAEIKRRFDESNTFEVQYEAYRRCLIKSSCEIAEKCKLSECEKDGLYTIDLKEFYDTCETEKEYYKELPEGKKKYIADLMLTNSQDDKMPPVCIEIWVTHECTEDKKKYGGRIIEIKINSEVDALAPIIESHSFEKPIRFFNFKKRLFLKPSYNFLHLKMKDGIIIKENTICGEGLEYDKEAENELIVSANISDEDQVLLYSIFLNKKGTVARNPYICSRGRISKDIRGKNVVYCGYYQKQDGCPCPRFQYSREKGEKLLRDRFGKIPYWTQDDSKEIN